MNCGLDVSEMVWNILIPKLRVLSTMVCYTIIAVSVGSLLHFPRIHKCWITILFFMLMFIWMVFVTFLEID